MPLLNALYPVAICLVIMGMLHRACDRAPLVWRWVVGLVAVVSVICSVRDAFFPGVHIWFDALPLADWGMAWVTPALLGALVASAHRSPSASGPRRVGCSERRVGIRHFDA